jgi:Flp pilus assembly protein TadG
MNTRMRPSGRRVGLRTSRGLATVEFAICAPLLLLLMLATAEVGRCMYQYNTLTKAVRDGARYAVVNASVGTTRIVSITAATRTAAQNLVVTGNRAGTGTPLLPGLTVGNVTVTDAGNGFVRVAAAYTFQPILGAMLPTMGSRAPINLRIPLSAAIVMRAL